MTSLPQQIEPVLRKSVLAVGAGHEAAGFANQKRAGGDIPGIEPPLPEGVEPPGGDIGEIERGAAHPPHIDDPSHDGLKLLQEPGMLRRLAEVGNAAAEDRLRQVAAPGDPRRRLPPKAPCPFSVTYISSLAGL